MEYSVPTKLTPEGNKLFRELYFKHTGIRMTEEEADETGCWLIRLFVLLVRHDREKLTKEKGSIIENR